MGSAASRETGEEQEEEEEESFIYDDDGNYSSSRLNYSGDHSRARMGQLNEVTGVVAGEEVKRLMVYLKDVADNSDDLPKTQRDDPDLGRIVSTITPEDYAKKAEAFLPANIRIFGGVFTKYPKVWDLPTCEEFVMSDGAQEPGKEQHFLYKDRNIQVLILIITYFKHLLKVLHMVEQSVTLF